VQESGIGQQRALRPGWRGRPPIGIHNHKGESGEELYRMVWDRPMIRLAEEFGITENGLAKICDRLDVPYPPRGHWAKK
jgi:hypothetical protein